MPVHLHKQAGVVHTADVFPQYAIGRGTYSVPGHFHVLDWHQGTTLSIGNYCSIAFDTKIILGGEHRTEWVTCYPFSALWQEGTHIPGHPTTRGDVRIGNDVWIGFNACILSGVTVGDGAVIGANANVYEDVPPYTIVSGNPARPVKQRFPQPVIDRLLALAWWNWPEEKILAHLPLLLSDDIERFLDAAERTGETQ